MYRRRDEWIRLGVRNGLWVFCRDATTRRSAGTWPTAGAWAGCSPIDRAAGGLKPSHLIERTHAWLNAFGRLRRCTERRRDCVDAYLWLAAAIVPLRALRPGRLA